MLLPRSVRWPGGLGAGWERGWPAALSVLAVLGPAAALAVLGWQRRWISDDGLIAVRTVRQILAGNGPVFNVGERVESNTSALWTLLITVTAWLSGRDVAAAAVVTGLVCAVLGLALGADGARRAYRAAGIAGPVVPVGALVVLALPPSWDFATSGLETGLVTLWLGAAWWCLVRAVASQGALLAAFVVGLGPLVRPDLALTSAVFLLALAWALRPPPARAVLLLVAAAAAPVGYQVFRMGYYGLLVPMPALGKEAGEPRWERGLLYLADLVDPYALWLPLLLLLPLALALVLVRSPERGWRRRWVPVLLAPVAAGIGLGLYVVRVGGDFMHGRLLLPALLALLLPVLVVPVRRATVPVAAGVATWALVCAAVLRVPYADGFSPTGIADERGHYTTVVEDRHPVTAAPHVAHLLDQRPAMRAAATGAEPPLLVYAELVDAEPVEDRWDFRTLPLAADASVAGVWTVLGVTGAVVPLDGLAVDPNGLAYTVSGHLELNRPGRSGHEKWLPSSWAVADYAVPGSVPMPPTSAADVRAARRALGCGELREVLDSARAPMSWERFWDNLFGSPGRTTLRIPADPHAAERLYCGGGE